MRNEVRRGRKFIEYHDPDTQDENTFTQEISGADVSYQDEQGIWRAIDENWTTDGLDGYIVKADKLNHKVRLKGNGGRLWYPRRNITSEYITFGIPQYWTGTKWSNFGFSGRSVSGKTITLNTRQNVTILVHSRWNGVKIDWVLANSQAPIRMRYPVALTGITETDGVLYGADGERLAQLIPATATDANGVGLPCTGSFANGYVEFQADVSGAVYPVTIDPDFAVDSTDGYVYGQNASYTTAHSNAYSHNITGTDMFCGQFINGGLPTCRRTCLRFNTESIGSLSTVTDVKLGLSRSVDGSVTDFDIQILKHDWSSQYPLSSANRETYYDNVLTAPQDDSIWRNTANLPTQHVIGYSGSLSNSWVNKSGYTYYSLLSSRDASSIEPTGNEYITFNTAEAANESRRPRLSITYTTAGALLKVNMNGQMQNLSGGFN